MLAANIIKGGIRGNINSTQLVDAARAEEFEKMSKLLKKGHNANQRDEYGGTALMYAVAAHNEKAIKALLEYGADVNIIDKDGRSAFFYSILWYCSVSTVKLLIKKGADVNARDRLGNTPLMIALMSPDESKNKQDIIELLKNQ